MNKTFKLEMTNITWKIPRVTPRHSGVGIHMLTPNWGMEVNTAGMWNCRLTYGELITNNLSHLKVHLNSESNRYDNMNVDFSKNQYAQWELLTFMKCTQDFYLVTIIVNHNHFWPQINLNWRPLLLWLIFHFKTNQRKLVLLMWEFQ